MNNNRRDFLKLTGLAGFGVAGSALSVQNLQASSQVALSTAIDDSPSLTPLNRLPRMVQEYFVDRIREVEMEAEKRRDSLRNRKDALKYVRDVQDKIEQSFGPWPEKTPLNARVTKITERDTYNIENVIFDSRPDFPVTANLYVPKGINKPFPAVVGVCGHSANGKAAAAYQSFAQGLAKQGYVVLIYDPAGQGERLQYVDIDLNPRHGIGVMEHLYAGNQMALTGESLSSWFTWDGIRAVDYLLTRPEVDAKHIGVTGNSGGGTQTTWLLGAERRFTMGAPSCFVTTFRHNLENELPADTEQYPPRALALGLDHTDFIAAMAPKPVILLGQEKDYFDARGLEKSFARLKKLYRLLGAEENIQLFIGPDYHGYSQLNREAMYSWFNRVTGVSDRRTEPEINLEEDETLWCTERGQVGEFERRTIFSYTREKSSELKNKRGTVTGDALKKAVTDALRLREYSAVPHFRILRPVNNRNYPKSFFGNYLVETEPGIQIPLYRLDDDRLLSRPPVGLKKALLYISHLSADEELRQEKFLKDLISNETDSAIFACDVRGIGESKPNTCGDNFFYPYGNDYFYAGHSMMFDYPYTGQKTYDILSVINLLKAYGHDVIHLAGNGRGSIPATFAALLAGSVTRVSLNNAITSYSNLAENEEYDCPFSSMIPDVLKYFDLPDCYRALEAKNITISYQSK